MMKDKDIKEGLTKLAEFCRKCVNLTKENDILNSALDLINRYEKEIEMLNKRIIGQKHTLFEEQAFTLELQIEIANLAQKNKDLVQENKDLKYLVEDQRKELRETKDMYWQLLKGAKVEAYLEFAKELNKQDFRDCWQSQIKQKIDQLANELIKRNGNKW